MSRIDHLRELVAQIGQEQRRYYQFFPPFADQLERELGEYLGAPDCVALSNAEDHFSFDQGSYRHAGLGFEDGKFRVPLMFKLRNLKDEGFLTLRFFILFTFDGDDLNVEIPGQSVFKIASDDRSSLHEYIYKHLCRCFSHSHWFDTAAASYQASGIGYGLPKGAP